MAVKTLGLSVCLHSLRFGLVLVTSTQMTTRPVKVSIESFLFLHRWLGLAAVWACLHLEIPSIHYLV